VMWWLPTILLLIAFSSAAQANTGATSP
jgi:hypothetical protein